MTISPQIDPRIQRTRTVVLSHTYDLLVKEGFGGVSVDEVSRRSGVAKTTIYRHWPTRTRLLLDACSQLGVAAEFTSSGSFETDIRSHLLNVSERLTTSGWAKVLPSILDAGEREPDVAAVQKALQQIWAGQVAQIVEAATDRGEIDARADVKNAAALVLGPLYYRRWFSREPTDPAFIEQVAVAVCTVMVAPSA
ncbi:hypothetical protein B7R22_16775 [Subtercola boreus]|uniref:HTH tetR-type domain-containing protein n=1 Tax=Subtercola boreus TaxID=120213 RepID=A0A3E0VRL3_9MICO|nr:TetR/AcrR family transcriptional regulator [Subtercola boreus]RFA12088.1 hypothetical protein B7R22_16775 [Subtercola boreus]